MPDTPSAAQHSLLGTRNSSPSTRHSALFWAIFLLFVVVFGASIFLVPRRYGQLIVGDGIYYYVYLRSIWFDGDLDFTNDYTIYQDYNQSDPIKKWEMLEGHKTPLGLPANWFSVGPAILWAPVFALTRLALSLANALGAGLPSDGYSYFEQAPLLFASITYGFIGLRLIYAVCAGLFSRQASLLAVLGVWLATNVVYYMGVSPSASHILSLFAVSLFIYLGWVWRGRRTPLRVFLWGLSAGLMALVRWQDGLLALWALFELASNRHCEEARALYEPTKPLRDLRQSQIGDERSATQSCDGIASSQRTLLAMTSGPESKVHSTRTSDSPRIGGRGAMLLIFAAGALLAFFPQMVAWKVLYGDWLTVPQGEGFMQYFAPQILNVWFSTKRGLFSWTPLILLAVLGWWPLYKRDRRLGLAAAAIFLLQSYVNGLPNDWWGGEAFGQRRFIGMMPLFALGFAALYDSLTARWPPRLVWRGAWSLLAFFVVWNNLFILQYTLWLKGFGHISPMPTLAEITLDKFLVPFRWLATQLAR